MAYKPFKDMFIVSVTPGNADNTMMLRIKAEH